MVSLINNINSIYPRLEGSTEEQEIFQLIEEKLSLLDLNYTRTSFNNADGDHSFSSLISVPIQGDKKDTLLITIPVNHPEEALRDYSGAVNIVLGLSILEAARESKLPVSLQVNFTGAEFGSSPRYPLGSRLFLENYLPDHPVMQLYFNLRQIPKRILIRGGSTRIVAPYWLITRTTNSFRKNNLFFLLRGNENQLYRFGLNEKESIITPFLQKDIPSLGFEGAYAPLTLEEKKIWLTSFLDFIPSFLNSFSEGIPEDWDKHYLFFQAKDFYLVIREQVFLICFLGVIIIALIYTLVFTRIFKNIIKLFFRYVWILPLTLGIIFLFNWLSSLIIHTISYLKHSPEIWQNHPLIFLLFKIALIIVFFLLIIKAVSPLKFTRNFIFYLSAGLITLFANIIIISVINISFTYYFLWAFIFFLLSNIFRSTLLKFLFFLPAPYWLIKSTVELFLFYQARFTKIILLSSPLESLVIALILLPFILLIMGIFQKRRLKSSSKSHLRARNSVLIIGISIILGLSVFIFVTPPYDSNNLQIINASQEIDRDLDLNQVILESSGSLGNANLWVEKEIYHFNTDATRYTLPVTGDTNLFSYEISKVPILNRKNLVFQLTSKGKPSLVSLVITADSEFTLFDSNFPFIRYDKGHRYEILIGAYPPNPLNIELTLPEGYYFDFHLSTKYKTLPYRFEIGSPIKKIIASMVVKQKIVVDT